jgi:hypothetical protein
VLWTANPEALRGGGNAHQIHHGHEGSGGSRGGARGNW